MVSYQELHQQTGGTDLMMDLDLDLVMEMQQEILQLRATQLVMLRVLVKAGEPVKAMQMVK